MQYATGFIVAMSMIILLTDARAAEIPPTSGCKGDCITVIQQIDGKLANSFAMRCSDDGQRCSGEGLLTLFDETVPVAASGIFTHSGINIAFYTKAGNLNGRAIFFFLDQQGVSKAVDLTTTVRAAKAPAPRCTLKTENDLVPGKIQVFASGYRPRSAFVPLY